MNWIAFLWVWAAFGWVWAFFDGISYLMWAHPHWHPEHKHRVQLVSLATTLLTSILMGVQI